jgi:hypothetical protein
MTRFKKAVFEPLVGQIFFVTRPDGNKTTLTLTSIEDGHHIEDYESFHLIFEPSENELPLPDNSYLLENEKFGKEPVFISATPTADLDPGSYYYESVFNVYVGDNT